MSEKINMLDRDSFCGIWKKIANDERRFPVVKEESVRVRDGNTYRLIVQKLKEKGYIYPEHHILHNAVRGLRLSRGFVENSEGFKTALGFLEESSVYKENKVFKPFSDYVTNEAYVAFIKDLRQKYKDGVLTI